MGNEQQEINGKNHTLELKIKQIAQEIAVMNTQIATRLAWGPEKREFERLLHQYNPKIALAGNIGFGKTTVAKIIGEKGRARVFEEDIGNPLLDKYYGNMKAFGVALQVNLSDTRLFEMVINQMNYPDEPLVYDRSHYEDPFIFAPSLQKNGLMTKEGMELCQWYFRMRKERLEQQYKVNLTPDLIVFVRGNIQEGWKRARNRNRGIEMRDDAGKGVGLTLDFYRSLQREYQELNEVLDVEYKGITIPLPQSKVMVSDVSNPRGILYVMRGVTEGLKLKYERSA